MSAARDLPQHALVDIRVDPEGVHFHSAIAGDAGRPVLVSEPAVSNKHDHRAPPMGRFLNHGREGFGEFGAAAGMMGAESVQHLVPRRGISRPPTVATIPQHFIEKLDAEAI